MKTGHLQPRPTRTRGEKSITWARIVDDQAPTATGRLIYRLCRRDLHGAIFYEQRAFPRDAPRGDIARDLWHARIHLRETVDARDLVNLGLEEAEPA